MLARWPLQGRQVRHTTVGMEQKFLFRVKD